MNEITFRSKLHNFPSLNNKHKVLLYLDFQYCVDLFLNPNQHISNKDILNVIGLHYYRRKDFNKMEKYYLMAIELGDTNAMHNLARCYMLKYGLLGPKIFEELTEYCFNPQRLTRLCNIYNIEMSDYMDII